MSEDTNDQVVYFARLHWIIFLGPILCLLISLALGTYFIPLHMLAGMLAIFALCWILMTWITYYFSSLTIQKKRVIVRTGVFVRQTVDIPLSKIETIDIRQSIPGSLLHYGALVVTGTGGTRHLVNYLQKPLTCRRYIEQLMNEQ